MLDTLLFFLSTMKEAIAGDQALIKKSMYNKGYSSSMNPSCSHKTNPPQK